MAVLPMKKAFLCGLKKDRKRTLEYLQRQGVLEVSEEIGEDAVFQKMDVLSSKAVFERNAADAERALGILQSYASEQKGLLDSFKGREVMPLSEYEEMAERHDEIMKRASRLLQLAKTIGEKQGSLPRIEQQLKELEPWSTFDLPLNFKGTKSTSAFIGSVPRQLEQEELSREFSSVCEKPAELSIVSSSREQTCIFAVCAKRDAPETEAALKAMGLISAPQTSAVPAKRQKMLQEELKRTQQEIADAQQEICSMAPARRELKFVADYYTMRAEKYGVLNGLAQSHSVFLITGYVPAEQADKLEAQLAARYNVFAQFEDPGEDEDVPVILRNNKFAEPVEGIIESYGLPAKGELDPSAVMAPFYYILFGLMLSDAAYGLIMVFGCLFCLKKFPQMEEGLKKSLKMFMYSGISTTFWGFMFGSFFGDAVNVIATTFFHRPDISMPPLWFEPVDMPMKMLVFSLCVGIIHLFTGLGVKLYSSVKSGHLADGIYDVVFWYLLVGGAVVYMLTMSVFTEMLGLSFTLPHTVGTIAAAAALIGLIGIVLTNGRESRNWGKRLLKGLYGAYGVTSYLSDILSYSRLLALGLATSVISTVFNKMGSMMGDSIPGVILFIVVFVIGHTLNLAINALGAYVHTNRLQFVEFFGKFYEGGGKKFQPFAEHTKYFKVKEDV
ncbi:MAG TPA: V-type ATP synthase subunit I [Candidatus Egerieimonas faecigallinarum]|nr:V-type ATP synthase subunit I [Candidatus Egerieimonas faecigallinarum]